MSYIGTILEAMKVQLQSIAGLPPVKHRTRPVFWRDEKKVVIMSLLQDELDFECFLGANDVSRMCNMKYTTSVTIMVQRNDQYDEDPEDILLWREQVRQKLYRPMANGQVQLPGAPTVWDCQMGLGQIWEYAGLDRAWDISPLTFVWFSKEPVNG